MPAPAPAVSLANALANRPGVYAVLVGSGVSRPAGIPTGWEVVVHLLDRLAVLEGAGPQPDLAAWYEASHGEPPTYSGVVGYLGLSAGDRQAIIAGLIDRPGGPRREPTVAHRAIARLANEGSVQVILTTNFDPLTERALDELGLTYRVLATTDDIEHAPPLQQMGMPVLVKLHRDWRDERMLNTVAELVTYDGPVNRLLDRVIEDHGMVIAGWSATWDPALREAFMRARSSDHAATYWLEPYSITAEAQSVISARRAMVVSRTADDFLADVADKTIAVGRVVGAQHPMDTTTAVAQLKMSLADPARVIQARDQVLAEANRVREAISDETTFPVSGMAVDGALMLDRALKYERVASTFADLLAVGCAFGQPQLVGLWGQALEIAANPTSHWGGSTALLYLRGYPALVALYAGGVAAVAEGRYEALASLFLGGKWHRPNEASPLVLGLNVGRVLTTDGQTPHWLFPGGPRYYHSGSQHLEKITRAHLLDVVAVEQRFEDAFDRFEAILGLVHLNLTSGAVVGGSNPGWAPIGLFAGRHRYIGNDFIDQLVHELNSEGENWAPVAAGLFGRAHAWELANQAIRRYRQQIGDSSRY